MLKCLNMYEVGREATSGTITVEMAKGENPALPTHVSVDSSYR